ncbi:hypothetical protein HMPREF1977_1603 [Capnocytophaga ochracea F0287]|uniref:Uncharacterized protein n=1 Tax=Capnocytophaga ochracea F0287 TaxID=873517 RepID=E4MT93_CAPOC|nr:hypothetical protein HMPREF1977_1603 [Capnocytophaga ochracea F0287]
MRNASFLNLGATLLFLKRNLLYVVNFAKGASQTGKSVATQM